MDDLPELLALSKIDVRLHELREARTQIPLRRDACQQRRVANEAKLIETRAAVEEAEHEQRRHEGEAADHKALLDKLEGQQHQVKSNDAYTALLSEMEAAKQAIAEAETRELEAMEAIEASSAALSAAEAQVAGATRQIEAEEQACDAEEAEIEGRILKLEEKRGHGIGKVSKDVVARYEKIAAARIPAVVIVTGETCGGCSVGIPAQAFIEILKGSSMITCGTCRRILVHEDHLGTPG